MPISSSAELIPLKTLFQGDRFVKIVTQKCKNLARFPQIGKS
jgi:hypothetical protein